MNDKPAGQQTDAVDLGDANVTTIIKIAPPAATEQNDRRAVRTRSRRERPRKLRPLTSTSDDESAKHPRFDAIEPDIESFVSTCLSGVALPHNAAKRSKSIRKRSLPSMALLSGRTFAAAEKKRKKEEQARQQLLAEEAAKKIMDSTMRESGSRGRLKTDVILAESNKKESALVVQNGGDKPKEHTAGTSVTFEGQSNILMPPLLVDFMNTLKDLGGAKCNDV